VGLAQEFPPQGRQQRALASLRGVLSYGCLRGPGGTRLKTVMPREVKKRPVVDDKTIRVFPDHRGLHAVVENLARYAADRLERGNAAAQN